MKKFVSMSIIGILMLTPALSLTGCGGGSASTSGEGGLTYFNSGEVGTTVLQAINLVALLTPLAAVEEVKAASISSAKRAPLISILEEVVPFVRNQKIDAKHSSAIISKSCTDGGDIELNRIRFSSKIIDADVSVNSCRIKGETLNGSMKVTIFLDGAIDDPDFTIETSNFTCSDSPRNDITLTDVTLIFKGITYNGHDVTGGSVTIGGLVSGKIDNNPINTEFSAFTLRFSSDSNGGHYVSVSGTINTSVCNFGKMNIVTNNPVFHPGGDACRPTDGEVTISVGGNSVKVLFSSDSTISIYLNGVLSQIFDKCEDPKSLCAG